MTRWWVLDGDDHERRIVEAKSEEEALDLVADGFADQYGHEYRYELLTVLGDFDTEESALDCYPDAT